MRSEAGLGSALWGPMQPRFCSESFSFLSNSFLNFFNLPRACYSVELIFEILEVVRPGQFISCHKTPL